MLTLIRCPFHPRFTTVARKSPRSFCQKYRCVAFDEGNFVFVRQGQRRFGKLASDWLLSAILWTQLGKTKVKGASISEIFRDMHLAMNASRDIFRSPGESEA